MEKKLVTLDGNEAAAHIAYEFTEIAAIYPITPSSPMAEHTDVWSAKGRKNMFGQTVTLTEMQSEAGAIAAVHGAAQTGSLATSFTSSQGLMLMIPVLHRISGERLPVVLHVAARTVGTHAMSIFGDHSDVMCCRNTGFAMLCSGSVQEVVDIAGVAHLAAVKGSTPFMHFFDGFRTSHEIDTVEMIDTLKLHELMDQDALAAFRAHALNPEHPLMRSTVQNPDIFFQVREACNTYYDALPDIVEGYFKDINKLTSRDYHLFNYYGAEDATEIIVAMGSVSGTVKEAVDCLNAQGRKVGFIQVHLYRPFSAEYFMNAMPDTVKRIAVLDRCKEPGSAGEPLYEDVCTAVGKMCAAKGIQMPLIIGGRFGLSSKDTDPGQILSAFTNLAAAQPKNNFTIGINDDVTFLSLPMETMAADASKGVFACKFWGLGGDGTVGANKNTVHIVSENAGMFGQAYFEYDAKKSFGVTKSHLRFSKKPIESSYYVKSADFVACHNQSYISQYDIVTEVKQGGSFLLNCNKSDEEIGSWLPNNVKRVLAQRGIRFFIIDATDIAMRLGLGSHTNTVLQAAFFATANLMEKDKALEAMKTAARKTYFAKGEQVVNRNVSAIESGATEVREYAVPAEWANLPEESAKDMSGMPDIVRNILNPINSQKGDDLPVSHFTDCVDGTIELGLTAYEKRGIAVNVPKLNVDKCIQCNKCSLVCPHAVIRPYLLSEEEKTAAPAGLLSKPAIGSKAKGLYFSIAISDHDCTGCGSCAVSCPVDALEMVPAVLTEENKAVFKYAESISPKGDLFEPYTIKGSQFRKPLLEFSAACAGCGETPYAKLLTQLFGDSVYWANATGCSQAWGAAMPGIPYTTTRRGFGPAWTNSLFENNAELCLGMFLSVRQRRDKVRELVEAMSATAVGDLKQACVAYLESYNDLAGSRLASDNLLACLGKENSVLANQLLGMSDMFAKKTFWMYGGDGWAYDIGFGGLDHVIASGENVNVFVVDTEMYSNTGGQSSKATPLGAVAKFASSGKKSRKKDLGAIMMTYGNVYVAQVAMGADPNQLVKALREAEEYDGPSVVIAYTPCASHGICRGMQNVQDEMKRAVQSGYWLLYRYDPRKEQPLQLDSKEPSMPYTEFLDGEVRYTSLRRTFPDNAENLFARGSEDAGKRYQKYKDMSKK